MFNLSRFFKSKVVVLELSQPRPIIHKNVEAIASLATHPGFEELVNGFRIQRAVLETSLRRDRHASIREVEFAQSGIYWLEYLEREVDRRVNKRDSRRPVEASPEEVDEQQRIHSLIERVGPQA